VPKNKSNFSKFYIAIFLLLVLIFALVGLNYQKLLIETFSNKRKLAYKRNIELKKKRKQLSNIYLLVRILIVVLLAIFLLPLFYFDFIKNIDDFVNFIELIILIVAILSFLKYGKFSALKNQIYKVEESIRSWVYGKYANIEEEISKNSEEIERLSS
jgi:NADH:ubiquinone oxidoreductase subunit 3 (subunit A)